MPSYTPPVSPNVILNFVTKPYTPPVSPNVILNFGPQSGGGSSGGGGASAPASFFQLF